MRVEDYVQDDKYAVRAELPGIDPDKDVEVTVAKGILEVRVKLADKGADTRGRKIAIRQDQHIKPT